MDFATKLSLLSLLVLIVGVSMVYVGIRNDRRRITGDRFRTPRAGW